MKLRDEIRQEIETIIKQENIDRNNFKETSKFEYQKVIHKFYYTFYDYKKCYRNPKPDSDIDLSYFWLHFREELKHSKSIICGDWDKIIESIDTLIPQTCDFYYLILDYGWVYEGKLKKIKKVLANTDFRLQDFYILPKRNKFNWVVCYCEDGDCLFSRFF